MSVVGVGVGGGLAIAAGVGTAGSIASGIIQGNAAQNAAQTQAQAQQNAINEQKSEFDTQQKNLAPWLSAGEGALPQLQGMASTTPQFTQEDFLKNQDPAYQFDLNQGLQSVQRSAAAAGGLQSGGTMKAINDYAQGQASNEYQNAYNRFMNGQNTQFDRLASIAGLGQTANSQLGQAGQNMANNVSNSMVGMGNAQAAGQIGVANAWSHGIGGVGNTLANLPGQYQGLQYMKNMNDYLKSMAGT